MLVLMGYDNRQSPPLGSSGVRVLMPPDQQTVFDAMQEADLYILNSESEGFCLVLLEAMLNRTPWIACDIADAHDLQEYGTVYSDYHELVQLLKEFIPHKTKLDQAFEFVTSQHLIQHSFDDIESLLDNYSVTEENSF